MLRTVTARCSDGVALRMSVVPAAADVRAVALCTHAMMTDSRYFGARSSHSLPAVLAAAGVCTYVLDWRGHGASQPPTAGVHDWSFDDLVQRDLPAALSAISTDASIAPERVVIIGHSLGGLVTLAAAGVGAIHPRRFVLVSTSVWTPGPLGWAAAVRAGLHRHNPLARRGMMAALAVLSRALGRAPIRRLGMGNCDESPAYVAQLAAWARTGRWQSMDGVDYTEALAGVSASAQSYCGGADWMCRPDDADALTRHLPNAPRAQVLEGADHFSMFRDRRFAPWWNEVATFIAR